MKIRCNGKHEKRKSRKNYKTFGRHKVIFRVRRKDRQKFRKKFQFPKICHIENELVICLFFNLFIKENLLGYQKLLDCNLHQFDF
jgi:hypothetical protein